ncbi:MAG: hypothetical protein WCF26_22495 [Candidatus Sulfotelmatobacter sp.]
MGALIDMGLVGFVSSGAGAFIGSYLKKKGENIATHEDISKLVDQVRSVTQATKEIEAKISGELWDRQRHWEAKRDSLLSAVKSLSSVDSHFSLFRETVDFGLKNKPPEEELNRKLFEAVKGYSEAQDMLDEAVLLVDMICGETTVLALREVRKLVGQRSELLVKKDVDGADALKKRYYRSLYDFKSALRSELGIVVITPQDSESSATPRPDPQNPG